MKILLVRPPRIKQAITVSDFMFSEPIGLEMIYSAVKDIVEVEIFDMMIETMSLSTKIKSYKPNMIGITSLCIDVFKVIELCIETKGMDETIITIVGGTQTLLNPEAFYHEAVDHIFEYSQVETIQALIQSIEDGEEVVIDGVKSKENAYLSTGKAGRNEYWLPDRRSTIKYRSQYSYFGYRPAAIMEFGLGCEKVCDFCLRWRIEGFSERLIDLEVTRNDLMNISESTIMFIDNDFFANEEKITTFIKLVKELKLKKKYIMYGSVKGIIEYKEMITQLAALGLCAVLVGYETFNDDEMVDYHKKSTVKDNYEAARILNKLDIDVWASFMAHPDWTKSDFKSLRSYIKELSPQITTISPLTPFPNLPLYDEFKDRLIFKKDDYEKWSFGQVIIKPSQMSLKYYYYELLLTNLYVNIFANKNTKMIKKFGIANIVRIFIGSLKSARKYIQYMIEN